MFTSFFLAGFEGATGYNKHGHWIDGVSITHHDQYLQEDYNLVADHGIREIRECVRWPLVDRCNGFDFSTVDRILQAARRAGVSIIYDLFHFGYPLGLDILSDEFRKRFAEYCYRVARRVSRETEGVCSFTPVNEPSYFAWAAGEAGLFAPYLQRRGFDVKVALIKAALAGTEAIWAACPLARIVSVDPFCRVVSDDDLDSEDRANAFNSSIVFESWDMIAGLKYPELGGSPQHLDIVGLNYYASNQWIVDRPGTTLSDDDPRRMPLRTIIQTVWERYHRELIITETSHVGERRGSWLREVVKEIDAVRTAFIPLQGVCWYPVLEMAEWHTPDSWTQIGLWDLDHQGGTMRRTGHVPALRVLQEAHERLSSPYDLARRAVASAHF